MKALGLQKIRWNIGRRSQADREQGPTNSKRKAICTHVVTVTGKAFYDVDHSGKDTKSNRRNYDPQLAVWVLNSWCPPSLGSFVTACGRRSA
jgi:hypothetical protein